MMTYLNISAKEYRDLIEEIFCDHDFISIPDNDIIDCHKIEMEYLERLNERLRLGEELTEINELADRLLASLYEHL